MVLAGVLVLLGPAATGRGEPPDPTPDPTPDSTPDSTPTSTPAPPARPGTPVATAGDVRFSLPTPHRVVAERRTADGWGDGQLVFEDSERECGAVHAVASGRTVAATLACDEDYAEDQAPTRSVAVISPGDGTWTSHDLRGEASSAPGLSPQGAHAVWTQSVGLLTWDDGAFGFAFDPPGPGQIVTVDDTGAVITIGTAVVGRQCAVRIRSASETESVPLSAIDPRFPCSQIDLALATPARLRGEVIGLPGTTFVVRHTTSGAWQRTARPPITAPGLDVYSSDSARAVFNYPVANTRGDLVAVGSPDRQHLTAQRYDPARQRWTRSRVVYDAGAPVCRRAIDDAGVLEGATFELPLYCGGRLVVLRSRTGETWH